jgi:hypothetical protein
MTSLTVVIVAIVPIVLMASVSTYMYKWELSHQEAEGLAEDSIFTCRRALYLETHTGDLNKNEVSKDQMIRTAKLLSTCDNNMLYYKGRCEIDFSKSFCTTSSLDGYLILRGIENAERPTGFTKI